MKNTPEMNLRLEGGKENRDRAGSTLRKTAYK